MSNFQLSPGIAINEFDLTTTVPAVGTTEGAYVGVFRWGPVNERILVSSENQLVARFGEPYTSDTWQNHEGWFTAANFLSYSDALFVVRVTDTAVAATATNFDAAYEGALGNSIQVSFCDSASFGITEGAEEITIAPSTNVGQIAGISLGIEVGDIIILDNDQELIVTTITEDGAVTDLVFASKYISVKDYTGSHKFRWGQSTLFSSAPSADSLHIVVIDRAGEFSGVPGAVLEVYDDVSTVVGSKNSDGSTNYWKTVLENRSGYVRAGSAAPTGNGYQSLASGDDGEDETNVAIGELAQGFDLFRSSEDVDVSLVLEGHPISTVLANYIIDNVVEYRRDCVAFITPTLGSVNSYSAQDVVESVSTLSSSSYAVVDTGYKYQYDKYADVYRWIPLNGDIAGLCARTDDIRDPWFSPAGYNRGSIKGVVKLALNPNRTERDLLYKNYINPVITQPGQGTILFGDKTFQGSPSAFDRINVRRLFIVLQKAIAVASRRSLFEFNDEFTRAQFRNLVEPFLRDVQGRRGIFDFKVVCDNTNNTAEVIDGNRFVGDIYVKPARSINFINLNFVAVRTGIEFNEIVGQF